MHGRGRGKLDSSRTDIHTGGMEGKYSSRTDIHTGGTEGKHSSRTYYGIHTGGREKTDSINALREPNYSIRDLRPQIGS